MAQKMLLLKFLLLFFINEYFEFIHLFFGKSNFRSIFLWILIDAADKHSLCVPVLIVWRQNFIAIEIRTFRLKSISNAKTMMKRC